MHDCYFCGCVCDCDGEDMWNQAPADCRCAQTCQEEDDDEDLFYAD